MSDSVAFFDVDRTLWDELSVLSFYEAFLGAEQGASTSSRWPEFLAKVETKRAAGCSRDALNAWFYDECFRDVEVERIARVAADWWQRRVASPGFWIHAALQRLGEHLDAGHEVVLVTGSFREIIDPLRHHVRATAALVAPLEETNGRYTGRLLGPPMIGRGKAQAVASYIDARRLPADATYGYGDDETDIPFLEHTAHPVVVAHGTSPMVDIAHARGWCLLQW